jgi:general secretion pathway protein I
MLAVIRAVNQTVSNTSYLRDKAIAHWVAMNKLTEARLGTAPPPSDDSDGEVEMAGATWHWRMNVTPVDPSVFRIEIKVAPKNADANISMDTVFGIYGKSLAPGMPDNWNFNMGVAAGNSASSGSSASSSASSRAVPGPLN